MQINLFNSTQIQNDSNRQGKQVLTRKFQIEGKLDTLYQIQPRSSELETFIEHCEELKKQERHYDNIIENFFDSHYELELLGVGKYSRKYTIVVDFSESLDIILSLITGCDPRAVRELQNYTQISKSILNFELEGYDTFPMMNIIELSPEIDRWFNKITYENRLENDNLQIKDAAFGILFTFYEAVQSTLERIKNYVASYLTCHLNDAVWRSKSRSAVIITSALLCIEDSIALVNQNNTEFQSFAKVYSLERFQYAKKLGEGTIAYIR